MEQAFGVEHGNLRIQLRDRLEAYPKLGVAGVQELQNPKLPGQVLEWETENRKQESEWGWEAKFCVS